MTNVDKLNAIFAEVFSVDVTALSTDFKKNSVDCWDSVHQLSLTSSMEDAFDIMLDPEDILNCNSYEDAKQILIKYQIEL